MIHLSISNGLVQRHLGRKRIILEINSLKRDTRPSMDSMTGSMTCALCCVSVPVSEALTILKAKDSRRKPILIFRSFSVNT